LRGAAACVTEPCAFLFNVHCPLHGGFLSGPPPTRL
jgi:hypothetical protein